MSVSQPLASSTAVALAFAALAGCASVRYQRPGHRIEPRAEQTLVFGRIRFFHDGSEFFPWEVSLFAPGIGVVTERHLWLLRLDRRAVSSELHPDPDGSLAIWLEHGDYALLASSEIPPAGMPPPYEVVALLRVPAGTIIAYVGELHLVTESHEGSHVSYGELGETSVVYLPADTVSMELERRFGALPEKPILSPWCADDRLPDFDDAELATRARERLDRGCTGAPLPERGEP
jgi:hypothetical protein